MQGLEPLAMRVGIQHGAVVVGNFGDTRRYDYTAIGPAVNAAVALETACKPGEVFISGEVYDHLPEDAAEPAGQTATASAEPIQCFRLVRQDQTSAPEPPAGEAPPEAQTTALH